MSIKASFLVNISISLVLLAGISSNSYASSLLFSSLHDYGDGVGEFNPGGSDVLSADKVTVADDSTSRFSDAFDLASITGVIDRIELTLTFDNAGPSCFFSLCSEEWFVRAQGSTSGISSDDKFSLLSDSSSPLTIIYDASTDLASIDVFSHSVLTKNFEFWFAEETSNILFGVAEFDLQSASIEVFGSPVPVPAALPLFTLSLAGMTLFRRNRRVLKPVS